MSRQATLFALKGVVVIERIKEQNDKLRNPNVNNGEKIKILKELAQKKPATEIIIETGIGKTVRGLSKETEQQLGREAAKVYKLWKKEIQRRENLRRIDVAYDKDTRDSRKSHKRLLRQSGVKGQEFIEALEELIFVKCGKLVNRRYRRMINNAACELRRNKTLDDPAQLVKIVVAKYE